MRSVNAAHVLLVGTTIFSLQQSHGQRDYLAAPCMGAACDNGLSCLEVAGKETCRSTDISDPLCTCGGVGEVMDPFFTGFQGQDFYFPAEAGNFYNLFSTQDHQINGFFIDNEPFDKPEAITLASEAEHSSFIGAVALQHGDTQVQVSCDEIGKISVLLNGADLLLDFEIGAKIQLGADVTLTAQGYLLDFMDAVILETDLIRLTIQTDSFHVHNLGYGVKGHLNIRLAILQEGALPQAHGIIGQTIAPLPSPEKQDAFPGDGHAADYVVTSMFGTDFQYNLFNENAGATIEEGHLNLQPVASSRRLLSLRKSPMMGLAQIEGVLQASVDMRRQLLKPGFG